MAFLDIKNVRIAGMSAGVPKFCIDNKDMAIMLGEDVHETEAFIETTKVRQRRINPYLTTSDLGLPAAEQLITDLGWEKKSIDALLFVSQTADYILPATACILQDKLGLSRECYATDISLGCSGWVYGLSLAASLVSNGQGGMMKRALLIAGDSVGRVPGDAPLFGAACTVTALEYNEGDKGLQFHFGTDGSGYDAIIIPDGGCRNGITEKSFENYEFEDGHIYNRLQCRMIGLDVFAFGISTAPKSVKKLAKQFGFDYLDYDYFVFHQANMKMNEKIVSKLGLDEGKVPNSIQDFGNTSSASIPLTIVTQLKDKIQNKPTKMLCCGFGVGLSWGSVAYDTESIVISNLVEVESEERIDKDSIQEFYRKYCCFEKKNKQDEL